MREPGGKSLVYRKTRRREMNFKVKYIHKKKETPGSHRKRREKDQNLSLTRRSLFTPNSQR